MPHRNWFPVAHVDQQHCTKSSPWHGAWNEDTQNKHSEFDHFEQNLKKNKWQEFRLSNWWWTKCNSTSVSSFECQRMGLNLDEFDHWKQHFKKKNKCRELRLSCRPQKKKQTTFLLKICDGQFTQSGVTVAFCAQRF